MTDLIDEAIMLLTESNPPKLPEAFQPYMGHPVFTQALTPTERDEFIVNLLNGPFDLNDILERLKRNHSPSSIIAHAFVWKDTPQGCEYWKKIQARLLL